tara:strand:+ start:653 stop:1393 length:741 start_codon:yes stop_codon:yes gene_type:complete
MLISEVLTNVSEVKWAKAYAAGDWQVRKIVSPPKPELKAGHAASDINLNGKNDPRREMYADALMSYGSTSKQINDALHHHYRSGSLHKFDQDRKYNYGKGTVGPKVGNYIQMLDDIFANNVTTKPLRVYTGVPHDPMKTWKTHKADTTKPITVHLPAYTSTSLDMETATNFGNHFLIIDLPAGTPAISGEKWTEHYEDEIILGRGMILQINPTPIKYGYKKAGVHHYTAYRAKIVGYDPVQLPLRK